jgi:ligand-binding sensor domain-containing protein/signal transduction histidine kinase
MKANGHAFLYRPRFTVGSGLSTIIGPRSERLWQLIFLALAGFLVFPIGTVTRALSERSPALDPSTSDRLPSKIRLVDANDVRFWRLPAGAGLSQSRAGAVAQDKLGFIWFATQYGLNRYDGYKSKVFKHEPGHPESLSCVYARSLFVDHAGTLWVGCAEFLDRFVPATETFTHYRLGTETSVQPSTPVERISEDRAGALWLATDRGLYRFDPATAGNARLIYAPRVPTSDAESRINEAEEDREGRFWVSGVGGLEEFDRKSGKVLRRAPLQGETGGFLEDDFGLFWIAGGDQACGLATWDPRTNALKCHSLQFETVGFHSTAGISRILQDRNGTLWFGSTAGLLKFDRVHNRILCYRNSPFDSESLESDSVIYLYQDREGNIWVCLQAMRPNFFAERPQPFQNFTYERGSLLDSLVTSIYEDHNGVLWIGSMGGLNRIDRRTGGNIASPNIGNEILATLEDHRGVLFCGTYHQGLMRLDRQRGKLTPYSPQSTNHHTDPIMRLMYDHEGTLWAAQYGGLGRYDPTTGTFRMYRPDDRNTVEYQEIKEDRKGFLWLGAQTGLHRFDPQTGQFKEYKDDPNDPKSLSDSRVNSIYFDHLGTLWVGTQNGLGRLDPASGTFKNYYEKDGLAGGVVSCILEDKQGVLWMSTNNGLSSFDPQLQKFQKFTAADGLPGQDLTGWGACYQSPSGEMFFGGFSGAIAFYPSHIVNSSLVPRTVLTDFRLSGNPVPIGGVSPLKQSIITADSITLSHEQNIFSIEFSALSFFNAETNRYRYKLDRLDDDWHEVGADQRTVSYARLPASTYTFEVQSATSRGPWSDPARLRIEILPAWYQTLWFRSISVIVFLALLLSIYLLRVRELKRQFSTALEARVDERSRIARELHDTLLQGFQGITLRVHGVAKNMPNHDPLRKMIDDVLDSADEVMREARHRVRDLRRRTTDEHELSNRLAKCGQELSKDHAAAFTLTIVGESKILDSTAQDEAYRIACEALANAFRHASASKIETEITYDSSALRIRVRDDGVGIDKAVLSNGLPGHWGLTGMRERAHAIRAELNVWSREAAGTEVELVVPSSIAYPREETRAT